MTSLADGNDAFAAALTTAIRAGVAMERATLHPWVVTMEYTHHGLESTQRLIKIVQAPLSTRPEASDHMPTGSTLLREDSFPAERFAQMAMEVRPRYRAQYEVFVKWRREKAAFRDPADAVALDYAVELWLHPGSNPLGD